VRAGVGVGCMAAALGGGRGSGVVVQPGDESRAVQGVTLVCTGARLPRVQVDQCAQRAVGCVCGCLIHVNTGVRAAQLRWARGDVVCDGCGERG
jgi:hypothetical protein